MGGKALYRGKFSRALPALPGSAGLPSRLAGEQAGRCWGEMTLLAPSVHVEGLTLCLWAVTPHPGSLADPKAVAPRSKKAAERPGWRYTWALAQTLHNYIHTKLQ